MVQSTARKSMLPVATSLLVAKAAGMVKFSFIVGSKLALFTGSSVAVPLAGLIGGAAGSVGVFLMRLCMYGMSATYWHVFAHLVPGLCASLYWTTRHAALRLWLPLACMVAFIAHPIGREAFPYALYWLIPVFLYFKRSENLFFNSLASTFIAHAVGSVIWLYTVPMTASMWLALIPVVAVERLMYAAGMVSVYAIGCAGATLMSRVVAFVRTISTARA